MEMVQKYMFDSKIERRAAAAMLARHVYVAVPESREVNLFSIKLTSGKF
jgi:hypothetical protein